MKNIKKISNRLNIMFMKERTLLLLVSIQNIIISLIVLIFSNVIISNANATGELDYFQIGIFNNICISFLALSIFVSVPMFIGGVYNNFNEENVIEHMLAVKITNSDIITAIMISGFCSAFVVFMTSCPIALTSFYFIGDGALKIVKIIIFLVSFLLLYSTITLYISTKFANAKISTFVSYIFGLILLFFNLTILNTIIANLRFYFVYIILVIIISIIIFAFSRNNNGIYN